MKVQECGVWKYLRSEILSEKMKSKKQEIRKWRRISARGWWGGEGGDLGGRDQGCERRFILQRIKTWLRDQIAEFTARQSRSVSPQNRWAVCGSGMDQISIKNKDTKP